jgi:hypothetical protein
MAIIGAYHEPSPRFIAALPALQEWASMRGIAGTDLEWCWAHFGWLSREYQLSSERCEWAFYFSCPSCTATLHPEVAEGFDPAADHTTYWLSLCGGCGVVWWF